MPWESDIAYNEQQPAYRHRQQWLRCTTAILTHRRLIPTLLSLVLASLILTCFLSGLAVHYSVIRPPCYGRSFGNPLVEPAYYVMAGIPLNEHDPLIYRVEVGLHHPLGQRSFSSDTLVAVRIPLNRPLQCGT